jgi:hypothetical protein
MAVSLLAPEPTTLDPLRQLEHGVERISVPAATAPCAALAIGAEHTAARCVRYAPVVKCIADLDGSPFDPSAEASVSSACSS